MVWYTEFNSTFWLSIATMVSGALALGIRYCFKSKCDNIELCGCVKIHRDVEAEIELEEKLGVEEERKA